jgi:hypothetical protein
MGYSALKSVRDTRSDVRFPTEFRAVLHWADNVASADVADIADNGLRFIGRHLPKIGEVIRVVAKGLDARGRVVWRTPHSCGVKLRDPINALAVVRANCFPVRATGAKTCISDTRPGQKAVVDPFIDLLDDGEGIGSVMDSKRRLADRVAAARSSRPPY